MGMPHYIIQDVVYETLNDDSINVNLNILEEDNSLNEEKCSICLNKYQENDICRKLNNCQHYFHKNCINEWLLFKGNCPCCRTFCK